LPLPSSKTLYYGGDYNPEQWSREVWEQDVVLMNQANVNLVTLGVFSWANIEVADGDYRFDWLDEIIELLHSHNISVDLATATASPPAWLTRKYPEMLPVTNSGVRLSHGGRQGYCPSSPIYMEKSVALAEQLAKRYSNHPALLMWHVNNEYGCHNPHCFCEISAEAFITWLKNKYQSLDALNKAWGTNFWSQRYHDWQEISPPRQTPAGTYPNPGQSLDFHRFSDDQILDLYKAERDAIRKIDSKHPITTNFMSMKGNRFIDYWKWAKEVDFVSTDHYLNAEEPKNYIDLAFNADLTRGFANGDPWLLMEHSTSAVNWQNLNKAKSDGEMIRNSMSHVARGSSGAMFFQWRASVAGSEKFHSAMVPHAGTETRIFRDVVDLGARIKDLAELGHEKTKQASVAMIYDYQSYWALSQRNLPSDEIVYPQLAHDWYRALWTLGVQVDFVSPLAPLEKFLEYELILAPMLYLIPEELEQKLIDYAKTKSLVVSYMSGISDSSDTVKLGGYGGDLIRETLGVFVSEFSPLNPKEPTRLSNGFSATSWSELSSATTSTVVAEFTQGPAKGSLAIAKQESFSRPSWYLASRLEDDSLIQFFTTSLAELGIETEQSDGVERVVRGKHEFYINHSDSERKFIVEGVAVIVPANQVVTRTI
jgi:beta-galactosidase